MIARLLYVKKLLAYAGTAAGELIAFGLLHGTVLHWTQAGLAILGLWGVYKAENGPKPA